jgi:hypothetical protein
VAHRAARSRWNTKQRGKKARPDGKGIHFIESIQVHENKGHTSPGVHLRCKVVLKGFLVRNIVERSEHEFLDRQFLLPLGQRPNELLRHFHDVCSSRLTKTDGLRLHTIAIPVPQNPVEIIQVSHQLRQFSRIRLRYQSTDVHPLLVRIPFVANLLVTLPVHRAAFLDEGIKPVEI